jgi:hypothetical protein
MLYQLTRLYTRICIMQNPRMNEKNSTSKQIAQLGLPQPQRSRALAYQAIADTLVGTAFAVSKLLHLR